MPATAIAATDLRNPKYSGQQEGLGIEGSVRGGAAGKVGSESAEAQRRSTRERKQEVREGVGSEGEGWVRALGL